ncbi:MAG: serine/threonine-protein kinase [Kofleriaceae bacterium]
MTPERWRQVQDVFDAVADATPTRRAELLAASCGADAELRAQVEAMLAADQDASAMLDAPPGQALGTVTPEIHVGERIGAYQVVRSLGAGGMGEVFLAARADGMFEQRVAIKVVRAPVLAEHVLARFALERQILARLPHESVARLYDAGTTASGRPYFVMEAISGRRIDDFAEARGLSVRERLQLLAAVCGAVAVAHDAHVVHRDLKPDNVLVTEEGAVKLLDFGIAKVIDPSEPTVAMTDPRQRMMTPQYAAPEQLRGEPATPATDVHALGVILYQLLTGALPYAVAGVPPTQLARVVASARIAPPSAAGAIPGRPGAVDAELDAICLRALARAPDARYAGAAELRRELEQYLARAGSDQDGRPRRWGRWGLAAALALALGGAALGVRAELGRARADARAQALVVELVAAGDALRASGEAARAERLYRRAIAAGDPTGDAELRLIELYLSQRRLEEAGAAIAALKARGDPRAAALQEKLAAASTIP